MDKRKSGDPDRVGVGRLTREEAINHALVMIATWETKEEKAKEKIRKWKRRLVNAQKRSIENDNEKSN